MKGQTKNAADRMFNLLKLSYHNNKDVFTCYDGLQNLLNTNQYVDVHKVCLEDFHNHDEWQNILYYRKPTRGQFKQTHVFTIRATGSGKNCGPTVLQITMMLLLEGLDDLMPIE